MYELKRSPKIKEQLKIGEEILDIDIDIETTAIEFNKCRNKVILAEQNIKKMTESGEHSDKVMEEYGVAITDLMVTVFGVGNTEKIMKFYENKYVELTLEVFPFIINVIGPKMKLGVVEMREKAATLYKSSAAAKIEMGHKVKRKL